MGGKSGGDQVTGYQYFANLVVMIGNRIEELKAINFDKRGWILNDEQIADPRAKMLSDATYNFTQPNIYGKDEGGIAGSLGLRVGNALPAPDSKYAEYLQSKGFPALSYPYLSYLVFKGRKPAPKFGLIKSSSSVSESGFYFGNNPFLKEMMLWVKRTRVRNDGRQQWYMERGDGAVVCEIDAKMNFPSIIQPIVEARTNTHTRYKITGDVDSETITPISINQTSLENGDVFHSGSVPGFYNTHGSLLKNINYLSETILEDNFDPEKCIILQGEYATTSSENLKIFGEVIEKSITRAPHPDPWLKYVMFYQYKIIFKTTGFGVIGIRVESNQFVRVGSATGVDPDDEEYLPEDFTPYRCYALISEFKYSTSEYIQGSKAEVLDINPIHKIREILTDDTAINISESEINDENFIRAADQIWDERLGISVVFTEKNCKEALDEICAHIEAGVRVNRQTGKYEVILFRDNWLDLENALHFDQSNIKRGSFSVEVMNIDDAINVLNVNYYDRANIKDSSFNVYENGLIQTMGRENAETVDFPYFMNQRNAEIVANWKLKQLSTPAWKGSFATSARAARKLNRYDIVIVTWPSKQIYDMPVRVMKINLGTATDTSVTIDFVEVVSYSNDLSSSIIVDAPVSGILSPQPASPIAFEVPYYALVRLLGQREADAQLEYNPELGYLGVAAEKPQNNSLNALLYTDGGTGDYLQFQKVGVVDYSSGVYLDQQISQIDASFAVIDLDYVQNGAPKFSGVAFGTIGQLNSELISFVSYDAETKILTVKRGVLDTVPAKHISGNIHFWGESFAYDSNEYVMGETVAAQVLTTTPSGVDSLNVGAVKTVEMNARVIRPYPPANVKMNGAYFPEIQIITNDIVVAWAHRNRLQQTGGEIIGWHEGDVTAEEGVTYSYELISEDVVLSSQSNITATAVTINASILILNKAHTLKLWSVRDGYKSYQVFEHSFFVEAVSLILTATASKDKVVGSTVPSANILVNVDESLKANMKFDGSGISGKSEAGAIITIEVQE